jgi:phenylalanyl-tRNA synthetase beta chain
MEVDTDTDDLLWLELDVGEEHLISVATHASNLKNAEPGTSIALARPGAVLFTKHDNRWDLTTVTEQEVRGQISAGVCCSAMELGVGSDNQHVLIIEGEVRPGKACASVVNMDGEFGADAVLNIAVLPNIARCQSIIGMAREVAALMNADLRPEVPMDTPNIVHSNIDPRSDDSNLCARFAAVLLHNVDIAESPDWLQRRLLACGLKPINNIVDASNYVMLELGQPTHAYDADRLPDLKLSIRTSKEGDRFKPLSADDSSEPMALPCGIPIVTSGERPVAIAGVIGGYDSRVTQNTGRILVEAANFDFIAVRRAQASTQNFTEASARFSRGVDPALVKPAVGRIIEILRATSPKIKVEATGLWDIAPPEEHSIQLDVNHLNRSLGTAFTVNEVQTLMGRIGLIAAPAEVECKLEVVVPSSRQDISLPCDLLEEVARLYGFDRIPSTMPVDQVPSRQQDRSLLIRYHIAELLVAAGLQEVISYTLTNPKREALLHSGRNLISEPVFLSLLNPLSEDHSVMRRSLLPNLIDTAFENLRHVSGCHIFELGVVVHPEVTGLSPLLPRESCRLGILMTGEDLDRDLYTPKPRLVDFFDLSGSIKELCVSLHLPDPVLEPDDMAPFHPGVCARVECLGEILGWIGEIHPSVADKFGFKGLRIYAAELDVDHIVKLVPRTFSVPELPRFPDIDLDLSVVTAETVNARQLIDTVHEAAGGLCKRAEVFDVYRSSALPEGHKVVGLRLFIGAVDRTLKMSEAEALRDRVVAVLADRLGATLRQ